MKKTHSQRILPASVAAASCLAALSVALPARADVRLPHVIASDMIVQRDALIPIWGWADPGEDVACEMGPSKAATKADAKGRWLVHLPALPAGGPLELTIHGHNSLKLTGILVGEVWLCSGQSNMEMGIAMSKDAKQEVAAADHPQIHLYLVPKTKAGSPLADVDAKWKVCTPVTVAEGGWSGFSAAAYYFGREIQEKLNVPVGLIESSWGGTRIEPWTPPEGFASTPALAGIAEDVGRANEEYGKAYGAALDRVEAVIGETRRAIAAHEPFPELPRVEVKHRLDSSGAPTGLYNGMIHPLVPYGIRGAIWYQGESNNGDGMKYFEKMKGLVNGWRTVWNEGDFPFYFVQIAPYNYGADATREPGIWNAQLASLSIPNTGMAVTTDIATLNNIHPPDKQQVGHRLALWALAKTYGKSDLVFSGPLFSSMNVDAGKIVVNFTNTGSGLTTRDGKDPTNFEVAGTDGKFVPATSAKIDGNRVVVSAEGVSAPAQVRFAWDQLAQPNLVNKENLPASPFSSADLPAHP